MNDPQLQEDAAYIVDEWIRKGYITPEEASDNPKVYEQALEEAESWREQHDSYDPRDLSIMGGDPSL